MLVIWRLCSTFNGNLVLPFDVASWQRLVWNWSSFLIRRWYSVQDSQPNNRTDRTATLYTVTFVSSHIPWSFQSLWESTKPGDGLCYLCADVYVGINVGGQHAAEITEVFNSLQNNIVDFDSRRWGHGLSDWLVHHLCLLQTMTVRPKRVAVVWKRSKSCWTSLRVWARSAQSSAYRRSWTIDAIVLVCTWSRHKLNMLPSVRDWIRMPRSHFLKATSSIVAKKNAKE